MQDIKLFSNLVPREFQVIHEASIYKVFLVPGDCSNCCSITLDPHIQIP